MGSWLWTRSQRYRVVVSRPVATEDRGVDKLKHLKYVEVKSPHFSMVVVWEVQSSSLNRGSKSRRLSSRLPRVALE
ncbi:hypothetical protein TNCV_3274561 [Trichonephila clavipes]|nr:hypothetical protein TNCV_3274561 [Trichonephila clavipes]